VEGINDLRARYEQEFGQDPGAAYYTAGDYVPNIPVTYWTFRFMMGVGLLVAAGAALILWLTRKRRTPTGRWFGPMALSLPVLAVSGSSFGWIFTEMGRQPWVVFGLMTTENGVSPSVSTFEAATSLIVLTLLYAALAVVEIGLMAVYVRKGADAFVEPPDPSLRGPQDDDQPLTFAY
ncbi:MAG: cytochrome ubiquinol oxidase subunit I, partial [Nocardioides sp.]